VGIPDVVGVAEIAERLGVTKSRADQITRQKSFPDGRKLKMGTVYDRDDVEAWIKQYRPRLDEPTEGDS
jgi:prophage regulatory protein